MANQNDDSDVNAESDEERDLEESEVNLNEEGFTNKPSDRKNSKVKGKEKDKCAIF